MTKYTSRVPALVLTSMFFMFAIAAIPQDAFASHDYSNGVNVSACGNLSFDVCGNALYNTTTGNLGFSVYGGTVNQYSRGYQNTQTLYYYPNYNYSSPAVYPSYTYAYPQYTWNPRPQRVAQDRFWPDYIRAGQIWDANMRYYNSFPL